MSIGPWVKDRKQKNNTTHETSNIKTPTRGNTFFPHLREYWSMGQRSKTKKNTTHGHVKHQNTDTGIHVLSTSPVCPCCRPRQPQVQQSVPGRLGPEPPVVPGKGSRTKSRDMSILNCTMDDSQEITTIRLFSQETTIILKIL